MHKQNIHLIRPFDLTRLACTVAIAICILAPDNQAFGVDERRLSFYHTHTRETLDVTYSVGGEYVASELDRINDFLSDFRTGDATVMDAQLLDVIYDVRASRGPRLHARTKSIGAWPSRIAPKRPISSLLPCCPLQVLPWQRSELRRWSAPWEDPSAWAFAGPCQSCRGRSPPAA